MTITPTPSAAAPEGSPSRPEVRRFDRRTYLRWAPTFLAFPIAGLAARAAGGAVDDTTSAVLAGAVAGAVVGGIQSVALGGATADRVRWAGATSVGLAAGLTAGAAVVDYETTAAALTLMGLVSGAGVGVAQALVLRAGRTRRLVWAATVPVLWALGWFLTSQVIVDADRQHANFGASGAIVVTLLSGLVLAAAPERTSGAAGTAAPSTDGR